MTMGAAVPSAFAVAKEVPAPYWQHTKSAKVAVSFSSGTAYVSGLVEGFTGTNKIHATFTLEKKNANGSYTNVAIWSSPLTYGDTLAFSDQCAVSRGNFRVSVNANVTRNGTTENVSATTYATY